MTNPNNYGYSTRKMSYPKPYEAYGSAAFTVSGSIYDVKAHTTLFDSVPTCHDLLIRVYNGGVDMRLNSETADPVELLADEYFEVQNLVVSNVYLSTMVSGTSATVKLFLMGW